MSRTLSHRHLEVFRAVVRSGGASAAARALCVSQPGVSKILHEAEALCGFVLFNRVRGRLEPTKQALRLFEESEKLFVGMEEIERLLDRIRRQEARRALIASIPVLAQELIPETLADARVDSTSLKIAISTRDAGGVLALVGSGTADIGFIGAAPIDTRLKSAVIARAPAYLGVPSDHPLARRDVATPRDLDGEALIAGSRHEGQQTRVDAILTAARSHPREAYESPLVTGAAALAAQGLGVTFCDIFTARAFLGRGLVLRRFEPRFTFDYHSLWTPQPHGMLKVSAVVAAARAAARRAIEAGTRSHHLRNRS